jgi:hypothetical protein
MTRKTHRWHGRASARRSWLRGGLVLLLASVSVACGRELTFGTVKAPSSASTADLAPASFMALAANPNGVVADGATTLKVTATWTSPLGMPITGQTVRFSTTDPALRIGASTANTNCQGQAVAWVAANRAGSHKIYAGYGPARLAVASLKFTCSGMLLQAQRFVTTAPGAESLAVGDLDNGVPQAQEMVVAV